MLGLIVAAPRSLAITLWYRARAIASLLGEDCYGNFDTIFLSDYLYWRTESEQGDLQENIAGNDNIPVAQRRAARREHNYLNDKIAELSSRGTNRVIAGSQHSIPLDHPAAVVSAVNEVVDEARYNAHH